MGADRERGRVPRKKRELAYEGTILKMYRSLVIINDRGESWDSIHHDGAAAVVPMPPDGGILTMRQYRSALDHFTLELPTGKVDSPEEPYVLCTLRELSEEIGMWAENLKVLEFLPRIDTTVALRGKEISVFVAQNLLPGGQHLDPDGVIDAQTYKLSELLTRIERGEIRDAKTIAGLTAYALKQSRSNGT